MTENPYISVVMPVYNGGKYLREAIESILNQTFTNFEFIIINDGSTDCSLEIIKDYAQQDKRIVVISRENKGLIASLNEGIEKAKGVYIARMDADDISLPNRFEKQLEFMQERQVDICGSHFLLIDKNNSINSLALTPRTHEMCFLSLVSKVPFAHPSVMMRKDFLVKHGLQYGQSSYKTAEDLDLWVRMFEQGAVFGNVDEILFHYRVLDNSLSKINNALIVKETKEMLNEIVDNNYNDLVEIVKNHRKTLLNHEEQALIVRFVYKSIFKKFNFLIVKQLKGIGSKTIVCTVLSEIYNG